MSERNNSPTTSFVQRAIEIGKRDKWCMSHRCTTCGADQFRNYIYASLKTIVNGEKIASIESMFSEGDRLMVAPWIELSSSKKEFFIILLQDMRIAELNKDDHHVFEAMRLVIMELHDNNAENELGNIFENYLGLSDFGIVLSSMRQHYYKLQNKIMHSKSEQKKAIERKILRNEKWTLGRIRREGFWISLDCSNCRNSVEAFNPNSLIIPDGIRFHQLGTWFKCQECNSRKFVCNLVKCKKDFDEPIYQTDFDFELHNKICERFLDIYPKSRIFELEKYELDYVTSFLKKKLSDNLYQSIGDNDKKLISDGLASLSTVVETKDKDIND
jgi:hypothetical protein